MTRVHLRSYHKPETAPVKMRGTSHPHARSGSTGATYIKTGAPKTHKTSRSGHSGGAGHRSSGTHKKGTSPSTGKQWKILAQSSHQLNPTIMTKLEQGNSLLLHTDYLGPTAPPLTGRMDFHQDYGYYDATGWHKGHISMPHGHNREPAADQGKAPKSHHSSSTHHSRSGGSSTPKHSSIAERDSRNYRPHPPAFAPSAQLPVRRGNLQAHHPSEGHEHYPVAQLHWPASNERSPS